MFIILNVEKRLRYHFCAGSDGIKLQFSSQMVDLNYTRRYVSAFPAIIPNPGSRHGRVRINVVRYINYLIQFEPLYLPLSVLCRHTLQVQSVHSIIQRRSVENWQKSNSIIYNYANFVGNIYRSCQWRCDQCGVVMDTVLPELTSASATQADEARQLAAQIAFKVTNNITFYNRLHFAFQDESESKSVDTTIQSSEFDDISATMIDDNVEPPPSDDNRSADNPITTTTNLIDRDEGAGGGGTSSLVLIVLVSLMLAALLFRRLCMMNEWSYTVDRDGAGSGGSSSDL